MTRVTKNLSPTRVEMRQHEANLGVTKSKTQKSKKSSISIYKNYSDIELYDWNLTVILHVSQQTDQQIPTHVIAHVYHGHHRRFNAVK